MFRPRPEDDPVTSHVCFVLEAMLIGICQKAESSTITLAMEKAIYWAGSIWDISTFTVVSGRLQLSQRDRKIDMKAYGRRAFQYSRMDRPVKRMSQDHQYLERQRPGP